MYILFFFKEVIVLWSIVVVVPQARSPGTHGQTLLEADSFNFKKWAPPRAHIFVFNRKDVLRAWSHKISSGCFFVGCLHHVYYYCGVVVIRHDNQSKIGRGHPTIKRKKHAVQEKNHTKKEASTRLSSIIHHTPRRHRRLRIMWLQQLQRQHHPWWWKPPIQRRENHLPQQKGSQHLPRWTQLSKQGHHVQSRRSNQQLQRLNQEEPRELNLGKLLTSCQLLHQQWLRAS